jgi:micrococcal nuclease
MKIMIALLAYASIRKRMNYRFLGRIALSLLLSSVLMLALGALGCQSSVTLRQAPTYATPNPVATTYPISKAVPAPTSALGDWAQVVRVIDGDTVELLGGDRVRYIGIDTPETYGESECYGQEATARNRELVEGERVWLEKDVSETDRYDRLLRYVFVDGVFVNAELVELGYARASMYPPDVKYADLFLSLQREAMEEDRGLWSACANDYKTSAPSSSPNVPTPPAPNGNGNVVITFIFFDGLVPRGESDEYVVIENRGLSLQEMTGWSLYSEGGQTFYFPPGFVMGPGQSCSIYTNQMHPETCGLSFGRGSAVWNNRGDAGILYDARGKEVSRYSY